VTNPSRFEQADLHTALHHLGNAGLIQIIRLLRTKYYRVLTESLNGILISITLAAQRLADANLQRALTQISRWETAVFRNPKVDNSVASHAVA
jgi:hypothetical protein